MNRKDFQELEKKIKRKIYEIISTKQKDKSSIKLDHHIKFVEWISGIPRKNCVEIFTTNYDCLIEETFEDLSVPFYSGFSGSLSPFFDVNSVEDLDFISEWSKLWKIHGSINWSYDSEKQKIIKTNSNCNDELLIYPSNLKYQESRRLPYIALIERLRELLKKNTILLTCGYSWQDEHINDTIISALNRNPTGSVFAFLHEDHLSDSIQSLCKKNCNISIYGKRQAIINTKLYKWEEGFKYTAFEQFIELLVDDFLDK